MKNIYGKYIDEELWLIKENEWAPSLQAVRESQFTLGNGYLGTRGVLEELPADCTPGTYIAGIYDQVMARVAYLVNLPNPFNFRCAINGEKLDMNSMEHKKHQRILDLHNGLLVRNTEFRNVAGDGFAYQSIRFVSMHNNHIGVMQIMITALDHDCQLEVHTGIDTSASNEGMRDEGEKRHFVLKELGQGKNAEYSIVETLEKRHAVLFWNGLSYEMSGKKIYAKDNILEITLEKGKPVFFTKVFYVKHFPGNTNYTIYKKNTYTKFNRAFHTDFKTLLDAHIEQWHTIWDRSDIQIKGTANLQKNLRFNIYHMHICAPDNDGFSSIGARTLSGEGYKGHVFWDSEIFLFPFYLYTNPNVSKNMLLYRYKRIDMARELAKEAGYAGAKFPWESAGIGDEQTPDWAKDINGKIVKIYTHKMELHITADIAYAVYSYYTATEDEEFMIQYGYELLFETARFWTSRVEYIKRKQVYEINHVVGPDEFHANVNNSVYTNFLARWNLNTAHKIGTTLKKNHPQVYTALKRKLNLKDKEVSEWRTIAAKLKNPAINRKGIIEQFDGYFKLRNVPIVETDENGIPILPSRLGSKDLGKTQLIKQADVLMLMHLFPHLFDQKTKRANYDYYMPRTVHRSSLSPSFCSIAACQAKDIFRAYHLFNVTLRADISNLYGNTHEGIHAASCGGTYQAVVFGFAGITVHESILSINPRIPRTWNMVLFSFLWKGALLRLELTHNDVCIYVEQAKQTYIKVRVFNTIRELRRNTKYTFKRKEKQVFGFYY